ncbi:MAG TPA: hypothetical protein VI759_05005 [Dehalococcoidia bacterium]|nr:hypothetical protein [Dehalococcoidia bacterium]
MTVKELRETCVDAFPRSATRPAIMEGLEQVIAELVDKRVRGDLWIDGSFVTQKVDPSDVDVVLRVSGEFYESASPDQRAVVDMMTPALKATHNCDAYVFPNWPNGHEKYWVAETWYGYWMRQWGFNRDGVLKGMAEIQLGDADA